MKRKSIKSLIAVFAVITLCSCGQAEENTAEISGTITVSNQTEVQTTDESETKIELQTQEEKSSETSVESKTENKTESETTSSQEAEIETKTVTVTESQTVAETESKIDFSEESVFKFIYDGKCFGLDEISDVKTVFGNPETPEISAPSCMGEGNDIVYTYDGFTVTAFEGTNGSFYVTAINVTSDKITNSKGLNVGIDENNAQKILGGEEYCEEGNFSISFFSESGIVTEVDYTYYL